MSVCKMTMEILLKKHQWGEVIPNLVTMFFLLKMEIFSDVLNTDECR